MGMRKGTSYWLFVHDNSAIASGIFLQPSQPNCGFVNATDSKWITVVIYKESTKEK